MQAEELSGIPHELLIAIAYVESKLSPYAVNLQVDRKIDRLLKRVGVKFRRAKGYKAKYMYSIYPRSFVEAEKLIPLLRYAKTYDVGVMQVNKANILSVQRKGLIRSVLDLFNPCVNIYVGTLLLKQCLDVYGFSTKAIDCYHKGQSNAKEWSVYVEQVGNILSYIEEVKNAE